MLADGTIAPPGTSAGCANLNAGKLGGFAVCTLSAADAIRVATTAIDACRDASEAAGRAGRSSLCVDVRASALLQKDTAQYNTAIFDPTASSGAPAGGGKKGADKKDPKAAAPLKTAEVLLDIYSEWLETYPISCIVEPFAAADAAMCQALITKGNPGLASRLKQAAAVATQPTQGPPSLTVANVASSSAETASHQGSVLLRLSAGGTVTKCLSMLAAERQAGNAVIVDTAEDTVFETESDMFAAELAVGAGAAGLKVGGLLSPACRATLARLLAIEREGVQYASVAAQGDDAS